MPPKKKKVSGFIKLQIQAGAATPAPPVGPALEDRSFTFVTKTPPAAELIKKAAGVAKGSGEPHKTKVAKLSRDQVFEIARQKMEDLNANDEEMAARIIAGTARSMGIDTEL